MIAEKNQCLKLQAKDSEGQNLVCMGEFKMLQKNIIQLIPERLKT